MSLVILGTENLGTDHLDEITDIELLIAGKLPYMASLKHIEHNELWDTDRPLSNYMTYT